MKKILNILSLFAGCGGLDLGFEQAENRGYKFKVIWANDIFSSACETFAENFKAKLYTNPDEPADKTKIYCGDVKDIKFRKIFADRQIDTILGGFPCQDFSVLRGKDKRSGIKVKRGRLYLHFVRALIETQPKFFVAENVKGLASANKGAAFRKIVEDFENLSTCWKEIERECGYQVEEDGVEGYHILFSDVVDFSKVGVPQRRQRLIIIGLRKDLTGKEQAEKIKTELKKRIAGRGLISAFPLTPLECFCGDTLDMLDREYSAVMKEFNKSIREVDSERKREFIENIWPRYTMNAEQDYLQLNSLEGKRSEFKKAIEKHRKILLKLGYLQSPLESREFEDGSQKELKEGHKVKERMKRIPPGENHEFVKNTAHHVVGLMSNIYRRVHPLRPAQTIIACGGGGTWGYHYKRDRQRLTTRERARLQTFPDSFVFKGGLGKIREQIGNAVPSFGARVIAEELLDSLKDVI